MSTRYGCPVTPQAVQTQLLLYHGSPEEKWGGNELWAANWWCPVLLGSQGCSGVASPRSGIQVHCGKMKGWRISILCQQEPGLNQTVWSGRKEGYSFWAQSWPGKMPFFLHYTLPQLFHSFLLMDLMPSYPAGWVCCHLQWTSAGEVFFDIYVTTSYLKPACSPRAVPE